MVSKVVFMKKPYFSNRKDRWSKCHLTTDMITTLCGRHVPRMTTTRIGNRTKPHEVCKACAKIFLGIFLLG